MSEPKEDSKRRSLGPVSVKQNDSVKASENGNEEKDDSYVRKQLISEESTTEETKREPSEERKTSAETDTEIKDEFSSSKWKPAIEKKASDASKASTNDRENEDMDVEMDDALEVNVKPDADLLPDLRTVISRPSSVSDADTDDYNVKPNKMMKKAAKDAKKKKRRDSLQDKHSRVVSYAGSRSSPDSGKRVKSKKEKKEKKSKKSKKSRRYRSSSGSSSPERNSHKSKSFV